MQINRLFLSVVLSLLGCGGDGENSTVRDYSGTWDVRYNLRADECAIVSEGIVGFVDQHRITQNNNTATFEARSGLIMGEGEIQDDGSLFVATNSETTDTFGDGVLCAVNNSVSYDSVDANSATTIFVQRIQCEDGYQCESNALGQAQREN